MNYGCQTPDHNIAKTNILLCSNYLACDASGVSWHSSLYTPGVLLKPFQPIFRSSSFTQLSDNCAANNHTICSPACDLFTNENIKRV